MSELHSPLFPLSSTLFTCLSELGSISNHGGQGELVTTTAIGKEKKSAKCSWWALLHAAADDMLAVGMPPSTSRVIIFLRFYPFLYHQELYQQFSSFQFQFYRYRLGDNLLYPYFCTCTRR